MVGQQIRGEKYRTRIGQRLGQCTRLGKSGEKLRNISEGARIPDAILTRGFPSQPSGAPVRRFCLRPGWSVPRRGMKKTIKNVLHGLFLVLALPAAAIAGFGRIPPTFTMGAHSAAMVPGIWEIISELPITN